MTEFKIQRTKGGRAYDVTVDYDINDAATRWSWCIMEVVCLADEKDIDPDTFLKTLTPDEIDSIGEEVLDHYVKVHG